MNTLIAFASKYGCTEKCAMMIKEKVIGQVDLFDLQKGKDVDLGGYDQVIIGGSVYMGKIRKEVTAFCTKNLEELKEKRIGLFYCGMAEGEAIETELIANFPPELLKIARAKEYLGGEFHMDKMNMLEKMVIKKVAKITENTSNILEDKISEFASSMN